MGTSTRPVLLILPTREKIFVPLLVSVPRPENHSAPRRMMLGTVAQVSTLLMTVGFPQKPLLGGVGRPLARDRDPPFDGGDQGRFLAGDEGAGALDDLDVEVEAGAEDVLSQEARLPRLSDGDLDALDGQRVFVPDVDEAFLGADGLGADDHALEDGVGIGLEDGAVHEGPRVALVAVADEVFRRSLRPAGGLPLLARGEPGPAPAPETGSGRSRR